MKFTNYKSGSRCLLGECDSSLLLDYVRERVSVLIKNRYSSTANKRH